MDLSPPSEAILDNRGSHAIGHHFDSDCEVTLPNIFEFSQLSTDP